MLCRPLVLIGIWLGAVAALAATQDEADISFARYDIVPAEVSTGPCDLRTAAFDRMMIQFMRRHDVPGAALAVTDHGRLVHARGYGYADVDSGQKVKPTSLFRIASISKPITAVAVLRLAEQGRLALDDKVFDILDWAELLEEGESPDSRLKMITVRHLLEHRGGWDSKKSFDPMFRSVQFAERLDLPPPAEPDAIVRCMFRQPLDFEPGERYAYSNYGYSLLGRIIEKVAGASYEQYVRASVLKPLGITKMRVGHTRLEDRQPGEVRYYDSGTGPSVFAADLGKPVEQPYGAWHLEAMDAHGGWLASAVDLTRFACAFDRPAHCPILSAQSIRIMFDRPAGRAGRDAEGDAGQVFYSCGWQNRVVSGGKYNRWHTGSLPGSAALLVRRHDQRNWVVLFNARSSEHTRHLAEAVDPLVHKAADAVQRWPAHDLF